jgi:hypothetical protein
MIHATSGKLHWNYFLALERDMETVSRYVEFAPPNLDVYSIELAHLLFAAASEADVICKLLCELAVPGGRYRNIDDYRATLMPRMAQISSEKVFIPRYGMAFAPWENWGRNVNPDWWRSFNNVKHKRNVHFNEATLRNSLNALAALLVVTFFYYSKTLAVKPDTTAQFIPMEIMAQLQPRSVLFSLNPDYYYKTLAVC